MSTKASVFITRPDFPDSAVQIIKYNNFDVEISPSVSLDRRELLRRVKDKIGIVCFLTDQIDSELLDAAGPQLKVLSTMSVGYDHIDVEGCKKRGIKIGFTPDVLTDATAELCMALLLSTSRRIIEATKEVTNGGWRRVNKWAPMYMTGCQLKGSTVGIVGLGKIGFAIAKRLKSFEVRRIIYTGRTPKEYAMILGAEFVQLDELLRHSDFVIVSCALTPETKGLFNEKTFNQMKPSAIFVNISRGAIVDQEALLDALKTGRIRGAGLDVTVPEPLPEDHSLTTLKNCVILPHIGSATVETRLDMAHLTAQNLVAGISGTEMPAQLR